MDILSRGRRPHADSSGLSLLVFLIDHVAGIIEPKQVVKLDDQGICVVYGIHARGNTILCFYDYFYSHGWGITVSELGPDPATNYFALSTNRVS